MMPQRLYATLAAALLAVVATFVGLFLWWAVYEPIAPISTVGRSWVENADEHGVVPLGEPLHIVREFCASRDAAGTSAPIMLAPPAQVVYEILADPARRDAYLAELQKPVSRRGGAEGDYVPEDGLLHALPPSPVAFSAGCHERHRAFAVPATIKQGTHVFLSVIETCNRIGRCEQTRLPAVLVGIGRHGPAVGR